MTSENSKTKDERAIDQTMDGLLSQWFESDESCENRIDAVLKRFDADRQPVVSKPSVARHPTRSAVTLTRLGLAVVILVACLLSISLFQPLSTTAAIRESIETFNEPVTRVYDVDIRVRNLVTRETVKRRAVLYSHSTEDFVVEFDQAVVQPVRFGSYKGTPWMRMGRRLLVGDELEDTFGQRMLDRLIARQTHFQRYLTDLPESATLRWLSDVTLSRRDGPDILCRRLQADLAEDVPGRPRRLVLWIDRETNLVRRTVIHTRMLASRRAAVVVTTYQKDLPFDETFFTPESQ